jgi:hypothetical protein
VTVLQLPVVQGATEHAPKVTEDRSAESIMTG